MKRRDRYRYFSTEYALGRLSLPSVGVGLSQRCAVQVGSAATALFPVLIPRPARSRLAWWSNLARRVSPTARST